MSWIYRIGPGLLVSPSGVVLGYGYAGRGEGYNNAALCSAHDVGPLPVGQYTIGPAFTHALAGPITMRLIPSVDTEMFGRDGIMCHGDTQEHADNPCAATSASHGCIVLQRCFRALLAASDDRVLQVTA